MDNSCFISDHYCSCPLDCSTHYCDHNNKQKVKVVEEESDVEESISV